MYYYDNVSFDDNMDSEKCPYNPNVPYSAWRFYGEAVLSRYPDYKLEILAPASLSTYKTAVKSGADAIYFGSGDFNARMNAENIENLKETVDYCHLFNVKAYLTLNTMLKDEEFKRVKSLIQFAEQAKIDAFIITDFALLPLIRKLSKAEVHASTQIGVHNKSGAEFLAQMGFDRVVLSRECTADDIKKINDTVDIDVEIFGHGALCSSFSGACLLSSMLTGKSGNRGRCTQLCRRVYSSYINGKLRTNGYLLSAKDICMADRIHDVEKLRICSLKIEGRMRSEEYVGGVTSVYSNIRDGSEYDEESERLLKTLFNRGNFTPGYWDGNDVIYPSLPNHIGVKAGVVHKVITKNLIVLQSAFPLFKNDCFKVVRKGEEIGGVVATGEKKTVSGLETYVAHAPCDAKEGDEVFLTKTEHLAFDCKKIVVEIGIRIVGGEPVHIIATSNSARLDYYGAIVEHAQNQPLTESSVQEQFSKTKDTDFEFIFVNVMTNDAFMTKKDINALRRQILEFLSDKIIGEYERPQPKEFAMPQPTLSTPDGDYAEVTELSQLTPKVLQNIRNIVYAPAVILLPDCEKFYNSVKTSANSVFIKFPVMVRTENEETATRVLRIFDGVVANNPGMIQLGLKLKKFIVGGWNLNIANSLNPLQKICGKTVLSVELNSAELKKFKNGLLYTLGRLPLMHLNFCPKKLSGKSCAQCNPNDDVRFKDGKGEYFVTTKKMGNHCQHELRNGVLTNLGKLAKSYSRYFDFTTFSAEEIEQYMGLYFDNEEYLTPNYNHLHLSRGVE